MEMSPPRIRSITGVGLYCPCSWHCGSPTNFVQLERFGGFKRVDEVLLFQQPPLSTQKFFMGTQVWPAPLNVMRGQHTSNCELAV